MPLECLDKFDLSLKNETKDIMVTQNHNNLFRNVDFCNFIMLTLIQDLQASFVPTVDPLQKILSFFFH